MRVNNLFSIFRKIFFYDFKPYLQYKHVDTFMYIVLRNKSWYSAAGNQYIGLIKVNICNAHVCLLKGLNSLDKYIKIA